MADLYHDNAADVAHDITRQTSEPSSRRPSMTLSDCSSLGLTDEEPDRLLSSCSDASDLSCVHAPRFRRNRPTQLQLELGSTKAGDAPSKADPEAPRSLRRGVSKLVWTGMRRLTGTVNYALWGSSSNDVAAMSLEDLANLSRQNLTRMSSEEQADAAELETVVLARLQRGPLSTIETEVAQATVFGKCVEQVVSDARVKCGALCEQSDSASLLSSAVPELQAVLDRLLDLFQNHLTVVARKVYLSEDVQSLLPSKLAPLPIDRSAVSFQGHLAAAGSASLCTYWLGALDTVVRLFTRSLAHVARQSNAAGVSLDRKQTRAAIREMMLLKGTFTNLALGHFYHLVPVVQVAALW